MLDKSKMPPRPAGMSQLDYLWLNFGGYEISNEVAAVPRDNVLVTEKALSSLVYKATLGGITAMTFRDHPTKEDTTQLIGTALDGSELTVVEMPKEVHVSSFAARLVTQEDIDNDVPYDINSQVLSLKLTNGKEYLVSLEELNLVIRGSESDTVTTNVVSGVVTSHLKIDKGNNTLSVVEIKSSNEGIHANLKLGETDGVELEKTDKGLVGRIPIGTTGYYIKFDQLTWSEYSLLEDRKPNTLYFITDKPFIYLNEVRYGVDIKPGEMPIVSLVYDEDHMLLSYKKADGSDIQQIHLGPANSVRPGMMSIDTYNELQKLVIALDGIVNAKEYIQRQVDKAAFSLELGEVSGTIKPLYLKNGYGDILSTVNLENENYLSFAVNKVAEATDVEEAAEKGIIIEEGNQILILTLTSGDNVYVDLNKLVDVYKVRSTDSVELTLTNNIIQATLKIDPDDKMLYVGPNGVSANLQVVRAPGKITFYGRSQTEDDKIKEIVVPDPLLGYTFIKAASAETYVTYPPRYIDSKPFDEVNNKLEYGHPYFVLIFGEETGDSLSSYRFCDFISINPILNSITLSTDEGNLLKKDEDGYLYCSNTWAIIR